MFFLALKNKMSPFHCITAILKNKPINKPCGSAWGSGGGKSGYFFVKKRPTNQRHSLVKF